MDEGTPSSLDFEQWERSLQDGTFEDALAVLRDVVGHLELGQLRLNDAVRCYEIGTLLARRCEHLLDDAELRISRLDDDETDDSVEQ